MNWYLNPSPCAVIIEQEISILWKGKHCLSSVVLCWFYLTPYHLGWVSLNQLPPFWVFFTFFLTHWGRVTHICVSKLTIIGSDNGLSPDRRQAIIWTNVGLLLIGPLRTNFSEILIEILTFSFKKMRLKVSSAKQRPFCLGLNVLTIIKMLLHIEHHIHIWQVSP